MAATSEEWRNRSIYFMLTDRFAKSTPSEEKCDVLYEYCNGTWKGITNNLDYIQNMGFDAIWITPVVENTPQGYHGYWAKDFDKTNPYHGTEEELKELVNECHKRDMLVMVDVVANHIGYVNQS